MQPDVVVAFNEAILMTILYVWTPRYSTDFTNGVGWGPNGTGHGDHAYGNGNGDGAGGNTIGFMGMDGYSEHAGRGVLPGEMDE